MRTLASTRMLAAVGMACLTLACSASRKSIFGNGLSSGSGDASSGTSSGDSGSGGSTANSTAAGLGGNFSTSGSGGDETVGCSADLRYIVDGTGKVVKDCWPNQGCSKGVCVDPCVAAADSQGNVGCSFVLPNAHFYAGIKPPCFTAFAANNWARPAKITVSRGGQKYDVSAFGRIAQSNPAVAGWASIPANGVPQDQVGVLFLADDPQSTNAGPLTCPIQPAIRVTNGTAVYGNGSNSGIGQAWKITSDTPISLYDIIPYGGAKSYLPSATMVMPTTAWGTNYIAVLPKPSQGPPWGQIAAVEDGTNVQILPTVPLPAAGAVPPGQPNVTLSFGLKGGEFVQWQLQNPNDMTGSIIKSDKPVVFIGGDAYQCYSSKTSTGGGCDSGHQTIPPVSAMAGEYVLPPYTSRGQAPESIPYRFVGAVNGTTLSWEPSTPPGAPTSIALGQKVDFETTGSWIVKAQDKDHPFYVGQLMTGCNVPGNNGLGDEDFVNILPPAQFLRKYVFFTDPTYPTTNLVFVRVKEPDGFKEVKLDCAGNLANWQPVGKGDKYQMTNIDLIRLGQPKGACNNGPHSASSDGRFGVMVWGLDNYSSYGYPAGGSVAPINTVIIPPTPK